MKIPLKVEESAGGVKPFAYFSVKGPHCFGTMKAFVDTGSPFTLINQMDQEKLTIPYSRIDSKKKQIHGISGDSITAYESKLKEIIFRDENEKTVNLLAKGIYVTHSSKKKAKIQKQLKGIPSIIGMDFLITNNLSLYVNPKKGIAYLEK